MDGRGRFVELRLNVKRRKRVLKGKLRRDFLAAARVSRTDHDSGSPSAGAGAVGLLLGWLLGDQARIRWRAPNQRRGTGPLLRLSASELPNCGGTTTRVHNRVV